MSEMALELIRRAKAEGWKRLDLGRTGIEGAVPDEVGELEELEELILSESWTVRKKGLVIGGQTENKGKDNRITMLSKRLPKGLKILIATRTKVLNIDCLVGLNELSILCLGWTEVSDLRPIFNHPRIKLLELWGTKVFRLDQLGVLPSLEILELQWTNVSELSPLKGLINVVELRLENTPIRSIDSLEVLTKLQVLDLSETQIVKFDPIHKLNQLKLLLLRSTRIGELDPIRNLQHLETLDISGTSVSNLEPLCDLIQLRELYIGGTQVTDLVPLISLTNLETISLNNTAISDVSIFEGFQKLKVLLLSSTNVSNIIPLKGMIKKGINVSFNENNDNISGIFIEDCPLTNPPIEIAQQGNEAILKYWDDLEKGQRFERYVNRDVQLILIGNSAAGKSTLAKYLMAGELSNAHPSTHGMETMIWEPDFEVERLKDSDVNPEGKCRVRILDFGGQEYYHDTHHLFFNDNTAYVLLWDQEGNKIAEVSTEFLLHDKVTMERVWQQNYPLQYWLDAIEYHCETRQTRMFWNYSYIKALEERRWVNSYQRRSRKSHASSVVAGSWRSSHSSLLGIDSGIEPSPYLLPSANLSPPLLAPTIIVQNKIDRDDLIFIAQDRLKEKFEFIYDFSAISLEKENPRRLKQLKLLIEELVSEMRIVGSELPVQYGWVKDAVEIFQGTNFQMNIAEFGLWANGKISKQHKDQSLQLDSDSIDLLINYLTRIGLVLHYPDKADLADRVFLQPDKVLKGIYEILRGVGSKNGRFDDQHAIEAQVDGDPASLLLLMRQFKIIFLEGGQAGKYVAPLYLNPKPIQGVQLFLDLFQKPVYRIQYEAFIHKSVVLHFFEVFGPRAYREETLGGQELYYYWRNGIVIKDEHSDARVLVQFFIGKEDEDRPEGFVPAHIDIFLLGAAESSSFLQDVLGTMETINEGWNTTVMVTHNGEDFVSLAVVEKAAEEKQFTFFYEGKIFKLLDFRKFIALKMPMKKVFISYSKTDVEFLQQLESHLAVFKRNGHIATWTDRKLSPGEAWDGKIKKELEEADIIIFLISADFLSTDYVWDIEIKTAIARDARGEAKVVPIVVRPCVWKDTPLWKFYSPEKHTPISMAENRDAAWERVVVDLERIMVAGVEGGGM